jgi:hypothetical protein
MLRSVKRRGRQARRQVAKAVARSSLLVAAENLKVLETAARVDKKGWVDPGDLPCALRSHREIGTCELSAQLVSFFLGMRREEADFGD